LQNYINIELPKVTPLEKEAIKYYESVTGENYKDDLKEKTSFSPSSLIFLSLIIKGKRNCAFSLQPTLLFKKL